MISAMGNAAPPGLYIHIPFCASKCPYCSFYSIADLSGLEDYLAAVRREISMRRDDLSGAFDTVYIGGGTPSLLSPAQIDSLLATCRDILKISDDAEITLEANPADIGPGYLRSVKDAGVNRLNIGVQSFNRDILQFLGRRHTAGQAIAAIEASEKAGFGNIGIDLMYAVPGQDMPVWKETLEMAAGFNLHHLSCYQLTIDPLTPLGKQLENGKLAVPGEESQREFFLETSAALERAGYMHYEVSNFAKGEPFMSRHNRKYWDHTPYAGIGAAAHSFDGGSRFWNHASVKSYLEDIKASRRPVAASETLSLEQLRLETLFLGLRTRKGIDMADFADRYSGRYWESKKDILGQLEKEGLIEIRDGWLRPTVTGLALADSLAILL